MTTTVASGPYEHHGAYADLAESERFDTSGTPDNFCALCEHAPCIAGAGRWCALNPRFITAQSMNLEIRNAALSWSHHYFALLLASDGLAMSAARDGRAADLAMEALAHTRDAIRTAIRMRAEVAR